ncbi:hypothetical protein D3C87_1684200 [compost metagenome]
MLSATAGAGIEVVCRPSAFYPTVKRNGNAERHLAVTRFVRGEVIAQRHAVACPQQVVVIPELQGLLGAAGTPVVLNAAGKIERAPAFWQ